LKVFKFTESLLFSGFGSVIFIFFCFELELYLFVKILYLVVEVYPFVESQLCHTALSIAMGAHEH